MIHPCLLSTKMLKFSVSMLSQEIIHELLFHKFLLGCNQGVRDSKLSKSSKWNFLSYTSLFKESCPKLFHAFRESCS